MTRILCHRLFCRAAGFILFWGTLFAWAHRPVELGTDHRLETSRLRSALVRFDPVEFVADFRAINS